MTAFVGEKRTGSFVAGSLVAGMLAFNATVAGADSGDKGADAAPAGKTLQIAALSSAPPLEAEIAPPPPKGFARLPPSGQMIAQALFDAQRFSAGRTPAEKWPLDRIAAERQSGLGWGQVFRVMKAEGLIDARNLNEAISIARHLGPGGPHRARYAEVSVSLGYGHTVLVGQAEAAGKSARPPVTARADRIDLGRIVMSDFDRGDGVEGRRYARPFGAVRIYRD